MRQASNTRSAGSVPNKSWQRTAMEKLRKHPSAAEWGQNQLVIEAKDLTDHDSIMNTYFSEILHHQVADRVEEQMQEAQADFVTTTEMEASKERSVWRVEDTAKLEVKLLLKKVDTSLPRFANTVASILRMKYGPLHTSLLINDQILLEWNTGSLVIPEHYNGVNQRYPIMTSVLHRVNRVSLISYDTKDETDLIFQAALSKVDILNALVQVIAKYNGQYFYHAIVRNCQTFVTDALKAMGCENVPEFQGELRTYFQNLKQGRCLKSYDNHAALDTYVRERVLDPPQGRELSTQEKEYLLGQYFQFHISELTEAEQPQDDWACPVRGCQMSNLEALIGEEAMLMHQFLHIEPENPED